MGDRVPNSAEIRVGVWRVVVATHTRELRAALFVALSSEPSINIVATAGTTAELITYCRALSPEVVILESGLPGRVMDETVRLVSENVPLQQVFLIGETTVVTAATELEVVEDVAALMGALAHIPGSPHEGGVS